MVLTKPLTADMFFQTSTTAENTHKEIKPHFKGGFVFLTTASCEHHTGRFYSGSSEHPSREKLKENDIAQLIQN